VSDFVVCNFLLRNYDVIECWTLGVVLTSPTWHVCRSS